ncbi:NAD(P)/FAD-dependent oxidoreductase [Pseudofrancisella aestuarii]|uniref:NAD(P)/FAD-dependent oxidoreductase n=1 Tax=Pseudofrancisella aestuarii TaxID=2670347 RepID=A0ABV9TA01_9GAMM|nr:NAD(P)-binding protein [Pseudofrancisella aestuarii]
MKKVAVIGSGISGLAVSYLLKNEYDVTLYEKENYYGGHSRTITTDDNTDVDTGFIVFNYETYHHLTRLFSELNVSIEKSDMSFGVSIKNGKFEYGSKSFKSIFSQKLNILKPSFIKMLIDILKFNKISINHLENNSLKEDVTLGEYLDTINVGSWFRHYYLLAMGAAIWSTPVKKMYDFPALTFIRFFNNHGLLRTSKPIQWYTVNGGSKMYVKKLIDSLKLSNVKFRSKAISVIRENEISIIDESGNLDKYDKVIFACHSNQVLEILQNPTELEEKLISSIKYQQNKAILHKDISFMPKKKSAWSSWVYINEETKDSLEAISLSYWMNNLQPLKTTNNYFVTINPDRRPDEKLIINEHTFEHPVFDKEAISAQKQFDNIQGIQNTYYCGAYLRYGFHEDGILSAVNVAKKLKVEIPWD